MSVSVHGLSSWLDCQLPAGALAFLFTSISPRTGEAWQRGGAQVLFAEENEQEITWHLN